MSPDHNPGIGAQHTPKISTIDNSLLRCLSLLLICLMLFLAGCVGPPGDINNACDLLSNKKSWYKGVTNASRQWNVPKATILAFIHQESKFDAHAKPPRKRLFGVIPTFRPSSAYGFPQALDTTWREYKRATGNRFADRDDFSDAADFIGWYINRSRLKLNLPVENISHHYLAYHEGIGGYTRGTYKNKPWLQGVAQKVQARSLDYSSQLVVCEEELSRRRFLIF